MTTKSKAEETAAKLAELDTDSVKHKKSVSNIFMEYNQFKSWAEEFDNASLAQKKMIACQLFSRIELEKGYKLHFTLNMSYQQFCDEWNDILPDEQIRVAQ